jgi:hypothetical protein
MRRDGSRQSVVLGREATGMADKEKREDFSREPPRESPKGAPYWSGAPRAPMEDNDFVRRAGNYRKSGEDCG